MPESVPYRLSIAPELERFRPELEYASAFLDRCHFVERSPSAARVLHYGPGAPAGALTVPAVLFPGGVRLDADGIHPDRSVLRDLESSGGPDSLLPFPNRPPVEQGRLAYDALGVIFLMLSRLEERDCPDRDRYNRFPFRSAMAVRMGCYADPLADRAAWDLAVALTGQGGPANRTSYDFYLTHDVDRLRGYHRPLEPARWAIGDLLKRGSPGQAWRRLYTGYLAGEPWQSFRELMAAAEQVGRPGRFYFIGPSALSMDSPYALTMRTLLKKVCDEIVARGHVVGFHPGFASATDAAEWRRQRDGLEEVIGRPVREGRQHVLQYDAAVTPDIWDQCGMAVDCTLAFPEASGFRAGTCRPHRAYSLRHRKGLSLTQIPTAVMDFSFFGGKYRQVSVEDALKECAMVTDACKRYGGTLVVLYHTGQADPAMKTFYRSMLELIQ